LILTYSAVVMKAPFPSLIENWHNDTYAAIDPTRPEVSMKGKKIIITGGGAGIGRGTVEAFAIAGAASIAITGRRPQPLEETKKYIESKYSVPVHSFAADVTDAVAMKKVAAEVGDWDVLVNNAGYLSAPALAKDTDVDEWWKCFEVVLPEAEWHTITDPEFLDQS
jgi:NAD(P)-dependent dehydrogenase (short-subunit alcohol dehydrogenase family)